MNSAFPSLGDILARALTDGGEEQVRLAARAQFLSACQLSRELAPVLRVDDGRVFDALTYIPDNLLSLLSSPEGWAALAEFVAAELGARSPSYLPTRH